MNGFCSSRSASSGELSLLQLRIPHDYLNTTKQYLSNNHQTLYYYEVIVTSTLGFGTMHECLRNYAAVCRFGARVGIPEALRFFQQKAIGPEGRGLRFKWRA